MRSLETRLRKLEAAFGPAPGSRFYIFGIDGAEIETRAAEAVRSGAIKPGQGYRAVLWRGQDAPPPPRWTAAGQLAPEEIEDAVATLALHVGRQPIPRGAMTDEALFSELVAVQQLAAA